MRTITLSEFDSIAATDPYYKPTRWDLYSAVIEHIQEIDPQSVLELGPYKLPLVIDGDTMDCRRSPTIKHNATDTPWPVEDGKYDLFIACQVWEHLEGQQQAAFREVQRIAKRAILSFPYRWNCPSDRTHHGITEATIEEWTLGTVPESVQVVEGNNRRIIYRFNWGYPQSMCHVQLA